MAITTTDDCVLDCSSAADIVSGAYPMPCHLSSVRRKLFFSNRIGFFRFQPIFLRIGLDEHNNIAQKLGKSIFFYISILICNGFLITKIGKNWEFRSIFCHFIKSFCFLCGSMWPGLQAYCGYFHICVKMTIVGQIFGFFLALNRAKIGQYKAFRLFSWNVSTRFTRNLIYKFVRVGACETERWAPKGQIFEPFWPSKSSKLGVSTISLKISIWILINLALYAHWSYFQRCVKYGPQRPNCWAPKS